MNYIEQYENEINIRKRNLETKRQVQAKENDKELEMLMQMETMLDNIKKQFEKQGACK